MYKKKHNFFLDSRRIMKDNKLITNIKTLREEQMQQTINTNSIGLLALSVFLIINLHYKYSQKKAVCSKSRYSCLHAAFILFTQVNKVGIDRLCFSAR